MIKAAYDMGFGLGFKASVHIPFEGPAGHTPRIMFVRHPADWLASYFGAIQGGSVTVPCVDKFRQLPTHYFDDFIRAYLKTMPGEVGRMYNQYNADIAMRIEDLPWTLLNFLESIGVPANQARKCKDLDRQNTNKRVLPRYTPSLLDRVIEAEQETLDRYDYYMYGVG